MGLLSSRAGLFLYLVLPNHWVWALLSSEERARVKAGDRYHNTQRPDYADPSRYHGGVGFGAVCDASQEGRRRQLLDFLDRTRPANVLEVGPGSGYLTKPIVEYPTVKSYVAVDVNPAFLEYLKPHLEAVSRAGLSFDLVHGSPSDVPQWKFDAIVLCSVVHHVPDRDLLFRALAERLADHGRIFAVDPTHYALRIVKMLRKTLAPGYLARQLQDAREGRLSTHAMCQLGEYQVVTRRAGLDITRASFGDQPARVRRWRSAGVPLGPLWRWTSQEMTLECAHRRNGRS